MIQAAARLVAALAVLLVAGGSQVLSGVDGQEPSGQGAATVAELTAAIGRLGSFEFSVRMEAARTIRRASGNTAVEPLAAAARAHSDEYVRYRALTLLSGFEGPVTAQVMRDLIADRNDRIRTTVFAWYEYHPAADVLPALLAALEREQSEFVRPALTRALAAQAGDARARAVLAPLVLRGEDFFRGAVIEALGDYGGKYALSEISEVARLDGPLQDDAVSALGKLGDRSVVPVLAGLQRTAPREIQPTISASLCLLGTSCPETDRYLRDTLAFAVKTPGYQPLLRGAVHALGLLAARGRASALTTLVDAGVPAAESSRAPIALGVGLVALRAPGLLMETLERRPDRDAAIDLVRDAFDMLSEDFEEERFFVEVRRAYWAASPGSARRAVADALMQKLEF